MGTISIEFLAFALSVLCGFVTCLWFIFSIKSDGERNAESAKRNEEMIATLAMNIKENEAKMLATAHESSQRMTDLTVQVARMMERLDHANKRIIDLTAKELEALFSRSKE